MSKTITIKLGELTIPANTVRLVVTLTSDDLTTEITQKAAEALTRDGISMRNVIGEWIKEEEDGSESS